MPKSNTNGLINLKQKIIKTIIFSVTGAIFGLSLAAIRPVEVQGAPSTYLNFQARLLSNSGAIVPDGNYHVEFKLYNQATLGSALWTETWTGGSLVSVKNGYLSVHLGSVNAFPGTINWSEELWLTMNIGGASGVADWDGEMNPRIRLTAVPFAFQSEQLAKTVGSNKGSLQFGSVTNDPSLVLPNESGTLCVQNSSNCGFLQGSGTAFLQGGNDFGGTTAGTIGTVNNGALNFITNNTTRMTLQSNGNLAVNTNTLFVDAANNRVGIGTAAPASILEVHSTSTSPNFMTFRSSSVGYAGAMMVLESNTAARARGVFFTEGTKGANGAWFVGSGYTSSDFMIGNSPTHTTVNGNGAYNLGNAALIVKAQSKLIGIGTNNPDARLHVSSVSPSNRGLIIQAAASQTANLQEWQNSTGTILASVNATGVGSFANLLQNGNQVCDNTNNCSYAPSTGGAGYIQNQTAVSQAAGFNISGNGTIGGNLAVNTNTLFVDAANNRVGIGTATPSETLDVVGNAQVSNFMQIGPSSLPIGTCQIIAATVPCTQGLRVTTQSTETTRDTSGIHNSTNITAPSANTAANRSLVSALGLNGPSSYGSGIGADISVTASDGATVTSMSGLSVRLYSGASSSITNAVGISTTMGGPLMTGAMQNATGILVNSISSVGSVQNAIGMQIAGQTAGSNANIGLSINESSTASLLLTGLSGNPNSGITFGFLGIDTVNLYRSGVGLLRTDNKLIVGSSAQINSGADANIGLVIQAAASQTANLQEWQSSTGTILASVSAAGVGSFANLLQNGNQVCDATNNCNYAPTTGGNGYIQNQTAIPQTAGFNITGNGTIGGNLAVDTNTLTVDATNNRVGIGTAAPAETLDVVGNTRVLGSMSLGNNSTGSVSNATALAINHITNALDDPVQCLFGCYAMALSSRIATTNTVAGLSVGTYAQAGTAAGSFTLAQANGMRIGSTERGAGTTITDNYGMFISGQTVGTNNYGLYIQGATTYSLFVDEGVSRFDGDVVINGGNFISRPAADSPIGYRVQNANGATLLSVDSSQPNNIAANSGAEVSGTFATNWTTVGGSSITRTTTAANVAGGDAAVSVAAGTTANNGVRNNLASSPATNTEHVISFSAKLGSGSAFTDLEVGYSYNGGTTFTSCNNYSTRTLSAAEWVKVSCTLTTPANAVTNPDLIIRQPTTAGSARTFYVDNLTMMVSTSGSTAGTLRVGGPTSQGLTLLTLDSFAGRPWTGDQNPLYGSMYYDTTLGKIQCYEGDGWGACGGAPDNIVNLVPEYAGSVLNGTGVGTMTADLCSDALNINDSGASAVCGTGQSYNFYKWTSPQATEQTYSVYISYQLPATFNGFADENTIRLTGRTSSTTGNNGVTFALYQANGVQCGTTTTVNNTTDTWQTTTLNGDETACTFAPNDIITFRINMTATSNSSAYVSNFSFTTLGK